MKKLLLIPFLIILISCECEDANTLVKYNIELENTNKEINKLILSLETVSFEDEYQTYSVLEDELFNLMIQKAILQINIQIIERDSKCL